ncbi:MAG: metallophosphoesterase family protein [Candidatus Bathyarchaeia archaeon]
MSIQDIFNDSFAVKANVFLDLINQVNQIISSERGGIGRLEVIGRLICLPTSGEAVLIGDIHGDLSSLKRILSETKFIEKASNKHDIYLVFLGDYGDRGFYSPEVYYVVLTLKRMFADRIILLQGNHEGPEDLLAYPHDLPYHLRRKFGSDWLEVYRKLTHLFRGFYLAVIVEGRFVALHGGVPTEAKRLEDLAFAYEKHPSESHLEEILWNDPIDGLEGKYPSPRGAGYLFGENLTKKFLEILGVKFLIRSHECVDTGYKLNHGGKVLTLFSRKGAPYHNTFGAYLTLNLSDNTNSISRIERAVRKF